MCGYVAVMQHKARNRENYHHGNVPETLIREAAGLLAERGAEGFSMREVARRAGIAVATPSHHFGNARGLLTAVAAHGFKQLAIHQKAAMSAVDDPLEKVIALCRAYVNMGRLQPGYASVMFRLDLLDESNANLREQSFKAFDLLSITLAEAAPPFADADQTPLASKTLWATMHGLLALEMIEIQEEEEIIGFAVRTLMAGMRSSSEALNSPQ